MPARLDKCKKKNLCRVSVACLWCPTSQDAMCWSVSPFSYFLSRARCKNERQANSRNTGEAGDRVWIRSIWIGVLLATCGYGCTRTHVSCEHNVYGSLVAQDYVYRVLAHKHTHPHSVLVTACMSRMALATVHQQDIFTNDGSADCGSLITD